MYKLFVIESSIKGFQLKAGCLSPGNSYFISTNLHG